MRVAQLASRSLTLASFLLPLVVSAPAHPQDAGYRAYARGDCKTALQIWSQTAQWEPDAMNALGMLYEQGCGVQQSYAQAMSWYGQAADLGHADAQHNIGHFYDMGDNWRDAAKWFRKSAEQGHGYGQLRLGRLYRSGQGVPLDFAEARRWMLLAAGQGVAEAQSELIEMGELVREVQRGFHSAGFDPGAIDGVYGPRTRRAIEEFQQLNGLAVDGNPSEALIADLSAFEDAELIPSSPDATAVTLVLIIVGTFGLIVFIAFRSREKRQRGLPNELAPESPKADSQDLTVFAAGVELEAERQEDLEAITVSLDRIQDVTKDKLDELEKTIGSAVIAVVSWGIMGILIVALCIGVPALIYLAISLLH